MAQPKTLVNARDIRNGWGLNGVTHDANGATSTANVNGAAALNTLKCRWLRDDMSNHQNESTPGTAMKQLADAMKSAGYTDPNPKAQYIIDYYRSPFWSWSSQQTYLRTALNAKSQDGKKLVACIEGPNEIGDYSDGGNGDASTGAGYYPDGSTTAVSSQSPDGVPDSNCRTCFGQWSNVVAQDRSGNSSQWSGTELVSPTILDSIAYSSQATYGHNPGAIAGSATSGTGLTMPSGTWDYGCLHYYPTGSSNWDAPNGINNNLSGNTYGLLKNHFDGYRTGMTNGGYSLDFVISEIMLPSQSTNTKDGLATAYAMQAALLDTFGYGGHRIIYYTATGNSNGMAGNTTATAGYNWFLSYPNSPMPVAVLLANLSHLCSLKNNYDDTSNASDTSSFSPAYSATPTFTYNNSPTGGRQFSLIASSDGNTASYLVCPKSDGSTMIFVWREPHFDTTTGGTNTAIPAAMNLTVNFGSTQNYQIWSTTGNTDGGSSTAYAANPIKMGSATSGSSATINLYSAPVAIELIAQTATSAPATPSLSVSSTTSTRSTVAWTISVGSTNAPSSFDVQYQKSASTGTWTTQANLTDTSARSYTFYGLDVSSTYFFRVVAKNSIGSTNSNTPSTSTLAQQTTKTPTVTSNVAAQREDSPNATSSVALKFNSIPASGNSVLVTWSGFGANGNSSSISAPSNAVKLSGPNNDSADEVTWAWLIPADGSTNSWTFSGYDTADNGVFNLVELTNVNTYEVSHGAVSTATATSIGWPIPTASFSNNACVSLLSVTHAVTSVGSGSTGVTVLRSDASSVTYHQSILTKSTASGNVSVGVTGATASDPDTYLNVYVYGVTSPNKVTGVAKANVTSKSATISWDSQGSSASAYKVEISSDNGSSWTQIGSIVSGSASSLDVSSLSASTTYLFRVSAYNDAGVGTASDNLSVTTSATPSIAIVQHATANYNSGSSQSITVALTNSVAVGNTLWFYFTGKNGNTSSLAPSGAQNVVSDSNTDQFQLAWTTTASATTNSFTISGFSDLGSFSVVELQGVSSIDTPTHASSTTYADGTSGHVTLPVTAPSSTPAIGIYGVNMDIAPDSYGTMPSNITLLDKTTGNSGSSPQDIEYHKGAIFQVGSGVSGSQSIPYVLGNSVTQGGNPTYVGYNFIGTAATNPKPGSTSLVFDSSTTDSITMHWSAASGTVTQYKINVSTNSGMT